jgi:glutathione S-transferase
MLKVWGRNNSGNVQKTMWCIGELGLEYERVDVGGPFGGLDTPEYKAMNPNSRVPTVEDDGNILWESHSVIRYLALKYGKGTLCPDDLGKRQLADRWMDWLHNGFNHHYRTLFFALVRSSRWVTSRSGAS